MKKLRLEHWSSTTNLSEKHYFMGNINRGKYVIGYNPLVVPEKIWAKILKIIEREV